MSTVLRSIVFAAAGVFILVGCSTGPQRTIQTGDQLALFDFSEPATFEEGAYADASLRIVDGVYRIALNRGDNEIWWAQWGDPLENVVIDVVAEQTSEAEGTAYGVACRLSGQVGQPLSVDPTLSAIVTGAPDTSDTLADDMTAEATESAEATAEATTEAEDIAEAVTEAAEDAASEATAEAEAASATPTEETEEAEAEATAEAEAETEEEISIANGDGYLFLVQGSGSYGIFRSRGRTITPLVNWTASDHINRGPASNELRAICQDDYLALYINGEFVADATDDTYTSGQVGLAASASNRLGVQVEFDDLVVREAVSG